MHVLFLVISVMCFGGAVGEGNVGLLLGGMDGSSSFLSLLESSNPNRNLKSSSSCSAMASSPEKCLMSCMCSSSCKSNVAASDKTETCKSGHLHFSLSAHKVHTVKTTGERIHEGVFKGKIHTSPTSFKTVKITNVEVNGYVYSDKVTKNYNTKKVGTWKDSDGTSHTVFVSSSGGGDEDSGNGNSLNSSQGGGGGGGGGGGTGSSNSNSGYCDNTYESLQYSYFYDDQNSQVDYYDIDFYEYSCSDWSSDTGTGNGTHTGTDTSSTVYEVNTIKKRHATMGLVGLGEAIEERGNVNVLDDDIFKGTSYI
ncbi:hypothetical protein TL16_g08163 [Triparma laevis f. inornata]|uniref:Uncharacterized protein n=1 Tax=Triparma laevis f. inornata TaxID=1714386 RepID=A0A9W7B0W2_9STRA|nr:hypothetical protein TL16_g08163 [Triparma laevis f. inornata]